MFLAVHAAIGAIAGNAVSSPTEAFALGFVSHFLADMIPHGDLHVYHGYKTGNRKGQAYLYVGMDAVMTIALLVLLFIRRDFFHPVNVWMGIIGGLLPDLLVGLFEILKPKQHWFYRQLAKFHALHMRNHKVLVKRLKRFEHDIPLRWGMVLQAVTLFFLMRRIF
jgi:hypothetical protein